MARGAVEFVADEEDDFAGELLAIGAPGLGAAEDFHAGVEVEEFDLARFGIGNGAEEVAEEGKKGEFVAVTGAAGQIGERGANGWGKCLEAAGDVGVADDLEDGLDGFFEASDGHDVFIEILLEEAGDALCDVVGEPPFFVAGGFGGAHDGGGEPGAVVVHHATVIEPNEGKIVAQGDHELKSSV